MSECGLENSESIFQSTGSQFSETLLAIVQRALSGHFLLCSLLISALFVRFRVLQVIAVKTWKALEALRGK
jgi:hypothetical protein